MLAILLVHGAAVVIAAVGAITDWRTGHIPNWLTLPPLVIAPIAHGLAFGVRGLLLSVGGLIACGLVPYFLFRRDAMAGGDVKLFAALGAVLGVFGGIEAQFLAFIAGALFALGRLAWRGRLLRTLGNSFYVGLNPILPKKWRREIPVELLESTRLGVAIFVGTVLASLNRTSIIWGLS